MPVATAVIGAGAFGRNHLRILNQSPNARLTGVFDIDPGRAAAAAAEYGCRVFLSLEEVTRNAEAEIVATPTSSHAEAGCTLLDAGLDVLIEKPIAPDRASAERLIAAAESRDRILQVGHLERFNPAVQALGKMITVPLFFEVHRLSVFSPRSLDVDVVLDLMIHDLDIVLSLTGEQPEEVRAAGISILSAKVDIANVRLAFPGGCVANLTASRVSTERVRKLRIFQPSQYISIDYARQDGAVFSVSDSQQIGFLPLPATRDEPLRLEVESFLESVAARRQPLVSGRDGLAALDCALAILAKIEEHSKLVVERLKPRASR